MSDLFLFIKSAFIHPPAPLFASPGFLLQLELHFAASPLGTSGSGGRSAALQALEGREPCAITGATSRGQIACSPSCSTGQQPLPQSRKKNNNNNNNYILKKGLIFKDFPIFKSCIIAVNICLQGLIK